ncbi:ArnT family glycosyltransferase [Riemerella columbina]|uniref:ArnT family glycosyltransferase n=1 Tax=Riemerella columbina TaxID=103810 RepID=UPI00266EB352|nr:glycosyltransferase family 39 protein [Riemerella columbina]WKS96055.1 glycosyltransferase family 39 protein [Riemerella columbina]
MKTTQASENIKYYYFLLFIILPGLLFHGYDITQYPFGEHAWAQSDHYAVALGFLDNSFDFFHPRSFTLNHQFPPKAVVENPQGITAVDFPILHYLVALMMKLFHTDAPVVFRSVSLVWSWVGLFFLYRAIAVLKNNYAAIFVGVLIVSQPIFVYYQSGFHVSMAAFSTVLMALSFFIYYFKGRKLKFFIIGMFFLTLAALMRFTHTIIILALLVYMAYLALMSKKYRINLLVVCASLGVVLAYFIYNQYLQIHYGSVFLNHPIVAETWAELWANLRVIAIHYGIRFMPIFHCLVGLVLIYFYFKYGRNPQHNHLLILVGIYFLGVLGYTLLMSWSLSVHNYYALDTWLPFLTMVVVLMVFSLPDFVFKKQNHKRTLLALMLGAMAYTGYLQYSNYSQMRETDWVISDFRKSKKMIDQYAGQRYMVLSHYGYNTPLIGTKQYAYRLQHDNLNYTIPKEVAYHQPKVLVVHRFCFKESSPDEVQKFKAHHTKIADNGMVSIWRLK